MVQLEKKMSAEKELLFEKLSRYEELRETARKRLAKMAELCNEKPWDAELDHEKKEIEHELAVIEFKIKNLKEQLE